MTVKPTSGLTAEEAEQVQRLRELVKDDLTEYYDTDFNLLRWLQGYAGFKLEEVAKKLKSHLRFRQTSWDLDNMHKKPRTHAIHSHWRYGITGNSEVLDNVIVNIEQCGETDYSGMLETYSIQEVMKARGWDLEDMLKHCMDLEAETGRQASILYVMDLTGLHYNKRLYELCTGAMRCLCEFMAQHYVELIKYFVLVNVPTSVYALWHIVKPLLPERTRNKVRILGGNWKKDILQYSRPEVLPLKWNDATTTHFEAHVEPPVSYPAESYYRNRNVVVDGVEKLKIPAGKTVLLTRELRKGDTLHWWISADADHGMGVYFSKNKDEKDIEEMEALYPCFECMPGPTEAPLDDHIVAHENGYYRVWMGNQKAWWHTLTVNVKLSVVSATPVIEQSE
ncbi:Protein R03A10.5 [Aphelenchoides avenae]|nr:Protein R03A10.5 [Aphelenchus avenae]